MKLGRTGEGYGATMRTGLAVAVFKAAAQRAHNHRRTGRLCRRRRIDQNQSTDLTSRNRQLPITQPAVKRIDNS
jgi:hypothetical protein